MKKIILGLAIVLVLSFCVAEIVSADVFRAERLRYQEGQGGCRDTDGGRDRYVKGTTCIGSRCETDRCYGSTGVRLEEYYCGHAKAGGYGGYDYGDQTIVEAILRTHTSCQYGCENGACLKAPKAPKVPVVADCIGEGGVIQAFGTAKGECCEGLHEIASGYKNALAYCTSEVCGNGECKAMENQWNCSEDCAEQTPVSGLEPAIDMVKKLIQDLNTLLGLLTNLSN